MTTYLVILVVVGGLFTLLGLDWDSTRTAIEAHPHAAGSSFALLLGLVRLPQVWADETHNTDVPLYTPRHAGQAEAVYLLDHTPRHAGVSA